MYHDINQQVYTRKKYIGGIPTSCITQFVHGNKKGVFAVKLHLCANERRQIRHTSLESARKSANRFLERKAGVSDYKMTIRVYPHHIYRGNKQATGAGADRVSQGIRASYGKAVGNSACVKQNKVIMNIETFERNIEFSKDALRKVTSKLLSPCIIKIAS
jgi:large subunit ribosomal protein L10e